MQSYSKIQTICLACVEECYYHHSHITIAYNAWLSICQWWGGGGGSWRTSHRYFDYMPFISSGHTTMKLTYYCGLLIYFGTIIFTHFNLFSLLAWCDCVKCRTYCIPWCCHYLASFKWKMSMIEFPTQTNTEKTLNFESKVQQLAKDHHHVTQEHNVASTRKRQGKKKKEMRGRRGGC